MYWNFVDVKSTTSLDPPTLVTPCHTKREAYTTRMTHMGHKERPKSELKLCDP